MCPQVTLVYTANPYSTDNLGRRCLWQHYRTAFHKTGLFANWFSLFQTATHALFMASGIVICFLSPSI